MIAGENDPQKYRGFHSASGAYAFNPATLIQRRPSYEQENLIIQGQLALQHERAHWFQCAGSTLGAALMTFHRAEEILLLFTLQEQLTDPAALAYVREKVRSEKPVFTYDSRDPQLPPQVAALSDTYMNLRTARAILTDGLKNREVDQLSDVVTKALIAMDQTYRLHTGGVRPWPPHAAGHFYRGVLTPHAASFDGTELTTRHLLEGAAFVNEFAAHVLPGWGGLQAPGSRYRTMPSESRYLVEDALSFLSERYSYALTLALSQWSSHLAQFEGVDKFGASLPTLACCFDIAINPPIPPMCAPGVSSWSSLYPPLRYVRAVEAVTRLGVMSQFPSTRTYQEYRKQICRAADLTVAQMAANSFRHPRFNRPFFTTATRDDSLFERTSSFDYLAWAMEEMNEFRRIRPLHWAIPYLTTLRFDGWDVMEAVTGEISTAMAAPLFWTGDSLGWGSVSSSIAIKIAMEKSIYHLLQSAMLGNGPTDLSRNFPLDFLKAPGVQKQIRSTAARMTGITEFRERPLLPELPEENKQEDGVGPSAQGGPRIKGQHQLTFRVRRNEVETGDTSRLQALVEELRTDPMENVRTVDLTFDGYNSHPDELWNIPKITRYMQRLQEAIPTWPWYFTVDTNLVNCSAFVLIFLSSVDDRFDIPMEKCLAWLLEVTGEPLVQEGERAGVDQAFLTDMTNDVSEALISILQTSFP
ncbi:hypothetical protein [Streptomyces sp. NPDC051016]|uniref:hypothetical protein n=1 Tax=Streptomyces sp. NPDC051016 TaxID=3365638 RepID=UPI003787942B